MNSSFTPLPGTQFDEKAKVKVSGSNKALQALQANPDIYVGAHLTLLKKQSQNKAAVPTNAR